MYWKWFYLSNKKNNWHLIKIVNSRGKLFNLMEINLFRVTLYRRILLNCPSPSLMASFVNEQSEAKPIKISRKWPIVTILAGHRLYRLLFILFFLLKRALFVKNVLMIPTRLEVPKEIKKLDLSTWFIFI